MIHSIPNYPIFGSIHCISTRVKSHFAFRSLKKSVFILMLLSGIGSVLFAQTSSQNFIVNGSFTPSSSGVTVIKVECWGGGGAGGGHENNNTLGGGGGAGGAYSSKVMQVTYGTSYPVTVAVAKPGGIGNGTKGDPSWFNTLATVYAEGGAGGSKPNSGIAAGGIGTSASSIGDSKYSGGNGASGTTIIGGAGGGGAGSTGIGGSAAGITAGTGINIGGGNGGAGRTTEGNGNAGITYGGGGGGAFIPNETDHSGGNGAAGLVVISWGGNYYKSKTTGDWNTASTWLVSPDNVTWINATTAPTNTAVSIQIISGHTVTVNAAATASSLLVDGSLTITGTNTLTPDNATINGTVTVQNTASFIKGSGPITFNNGSTYNHNEDGGTIPTATWNIASTCLITGTIAASPLGFNQRFGNFSWNCPNHKDWVRLTPVTGLFIRGNLTLINTGSTGSTDAPSDLAIHTDTLTIGGDLIITGGVYRICYNLNCTISIKGNVSITGGQLLMNSSNAGSNMTGTLNVAGNFTFTGGTINSRASSTTPINNIVFNGSGGVQLYKSGGTVTSTANSNAINFTVASPAFLQMATGTSPGIISANTTTNPANTIFNLLSGATLGISSKDGITTATTSTGNIQTTTRNFYTGANYTYNGTANQNIGTGFPTNLTGKLTIDDAGFAVTLDNARTIASGGSVNLVAGSFVNGTNLTMANTSTINRSEGTMTSAPTGTGIYNVNYTGNLKNTGNELAGTGLNNVSVNLTSGQTLILDQNRIPSGNVTINTGSILDLKTFTLNHSGSAGTLTVAGSLSVGGGSGGQAGSNFPSNYSVMNMAGGTVNYNNTSSAQIIYAVPTPFYNNLTLSNPAGVTLNANTTVSGTLLVNSTSKITISPGLCLTANTITSSTDPNQILIQTSPTGTGGNGSLIFNNTGAVYGTVEMFSKASYVGGHYQWQFIGIPLHTLSSASPTFDGGYVRQMHEEEDSPNHWIQLSNTSILNPFTGYEITQKTQKTYIFQGQLENAPKTVSLSYTPGKIYAGQNLIGNPYTAAIEISKMNFSTNVFRTVYLYNTGSYNDWLGNGSGTTIDSLTTAKAGQYLAIPQFRAGSKGLQYQIPSMQAFLVKATNTGATLEIPYSSVAVADSMPQRSKKMYSKTSENDICTIIDVKGSRFSDRMWLFTDPDCTHSFDNGWDGEKFLGSSLAPQLYAMEADGDYQVNSVDDINNTYLGFQAGEDSLYTFTFTHQNLGLKYWKVLLVDSARTDTVDITSENSKYTFSSLPADTITRRFKIITNRDISTHVTTPTSGSTQLNVFSSDHSVYIDNKSDEKGILYLYDMTGRIIQKFDFIAQGVTTIQPNVTSGTYLVKATTKTRTVAKNISLE